MAAVLPTVRRMESAGSVVARSSRFSPGEAKMLVLRVSAAKTAVVRNFILVKWLDRDKE